MVTSKGSTLKKIILIILTVLATVFASACLYFVSGCSLIFGPDNNTDKPDDTPPDVTQTETPGLARLDAVNKMFYVPDRMAEGYTYYNIEQRYTVYGSVKTQIVAEINTTDMQAEDGYFAVRLDSLYYSETNINLTVRYLYSLSNKQGDKQTYNFLFAGKIDWDVDHCALDNETGVYTWTAVGGATGYAIAVNGGEYDTVVDRPQFTVADDDYEFSVWPIFDKGDKYGLPVTIRLNQYGVDRIRYEEEELAFVWSISYDSEYAVKITDGDDVVECVAQVDPDYSKYHAVVHYTPITDSVKIQVTAFSKMFRPFTDEERTFGVLHGPEDIAVSDTTGELTWSKIDGFDNYTLVLEYADGTTETHDIIDKQSFSSQYAKTGAITARIKANKYSSPYISFFSEPFEFWYLRLAAFEPKIEYSSYGGIFTVSVDADAASVSAYDVAFVYESGEQIVTMDPADAVGGKVSTTLTIPMYEVIDIRVSRRFIGTEGRIYFRGDRSDFTKQAIALAPIDVHVVDKNATQSSEDGFKVKVAFPEALKGKGKLTVAYRYDIKKFVGGNDTVYKTNTVSDDDTVFFARPVYRNGKNSLRIYFSGFVKNDGSRPAVYGNYFDVSVGALDHTYVSYANGSEIGWKAVDGAVEYVVRTSYPDGVSQTFTTSETSYVHGIEGAGTYWFYITPVSDREFMMDGDTYPTALEKLEKPTVAFDGNGELTATSTSNYNTVVVKLDGVEKQLTPDVLRGVLGSDAEVSFEAYCTRSSTSTQWYYLDSETETYTLHRIAEVNSDNLGLAVDNNENIVYWTAVAGARDYLCRLFRRETEGDEFALTDEFTRGLTEIDGGPLDWGHYKLQIKPISYLDNTNIFLYLNDSAESMFDKDGIKSVTVTSGGLNLLITDGLYSPNSAGAHWFVALEGKSVMANSDTPFLATNFQSQLAALTLGEHAITVTMRYSNPAALVAKKTLLPNDYVLPYEVKRSETPDIASGKYKIFDTQDNSKLDTASVDITPVERTLRSIEHFSVVYRTKNYLPSVTTTTWVSEQSGLNTTATLSEEYINLFMLRVCAEKFIVEDGGLFYYKSSYESESSYSFAANAALIPSYTIEPNTSSYVRVALDFSACGYDDNDAVFVQYRKANGAWKDSFNSDMYYLKDSNNGRLTFLILKSDATSDGNVVIRIMHRTKTKNGVTFADSWFYYITAPLPDETT